jgi:threonylcarbamoyladenosine tRNA methylthiotransferase MtaB
MRTSPNAYVIVLGCYAQVNPDNLKRINGVDLVVGTKDKFKIFQHIEDFTKKDYGCVLNSPVSEIRDFDPASSSLTDGRTRAFLKIQDGCDYICSFCTIPLARGSSRSQPLKETIMQAENLVRSGYKEIVLTGVNVGDYGRKIGASLLSLLKELEGVDGLHRIRLSSVEPNLVSPDLIEHIAQSEKICSHFHIPLQSGNNAVLRLMKRRYTTEQYRELIHSIRNTIPDCGIGIDVIVGFPGEDDLDFEETYRFVEDLPVSYLHIFSYSEREDTKSISLPCSVDVQVRQRRSSRMRMLGTKKKLNFYNAMIGKTLSVLLEAEKKGSRMFGFTENYIRVATDYDESLVNNIVDIKILGVADSAATGEIASRRSNEFREASYALGRPLAF